MGYTRQENVLEFGLKSMLFSFMQLSDIHKQKYLHTFLYIFDVLVNAINEFVPQLNFGRVSRVNSS